MAGTSRHLTTGRRSERGAVLPMVAISMVVLLGMTAFAVDLGRQMLRRREMQAIADVISLDLVRMVDGRTVDQIEADPNWSQTIAASRERNNFASGGTKAFLVVLGHYDPITDVFTPLIGSAIPDAVWVQAADQVDYYFAGVLGSSSGNAVRDAVSQAIVCTTSCTPPPPPPPCVSNCSPPPYDVNSAVGSFQIGSFLAGANPTSGDVFQMNLLNGVLTRALRGGAVNLTTVGYDGLASSYLSVRSIAAHSTFGSPSALLAANGILARSFLTWSADALQAQGGSIAAVNALNTLAAAASSTATMNVGTTVAGQPALMYIAQGGNASALDAGFNVLNLVTGTAFIVNGTNTIDVPSLDTTTAAGTVDVSMTVTERPQTYSGPIGGSVSTSQVELTVTPHLANVAVPIAGLPGLPTGVIDGTMPITFSGASATGTLDTVACPPDVPAAIVDVATQPVQITEALDLTLAIPLLGVTADIGTQPNPITGTASGASGTPSFAYTSEFLPTVGTGSAKTVSSPTLGLAGFMTPSGIKVTVSSGSLLPAELTATAAGIQSALNPILADVDSLVVGRISKALGLSLGGADVGAQDMVCTHVHVVR